MKKLISSLGTAIVLMTSSNVVVAESDFEYSANVALTTNYMYRGFTQTSEGPAIQGGFDVGHSSGLYAGTWASSLEFGAGDDDTNLEIDFYGGYASEFSNGFSFDIGGLYYFYPNTDADSGGDFDFFEVYSSLDYTFADAMLEPTIGVSVAFSPDYFGEDGDSIYVNPTLGLSLPYGMSFTLGYGHLDVDGDKTSGPAGFDYDHYYVGISKDWNIFTLDATYYDADSDCGTDDQCESLVFTVSASF